MSKSMKCRGHNTAKRKINHNNPDNRDCNVFSANTLYYIQDQCSGIIKVALHRKTFIRHPVVLRGYSV